MALNYDDLTEPEQAIWNAIKAGETVELPVTKPEPANPAMGSDWGDDRKVRAQLLCELLTSKNGTPRALKVRGARITGVLDLEATVVACPFTLEDCYIEEPINLKEAQTLAIRLPGCHVAGVDADQLETRGNLEFSAGFVCHGQISLVGATIGGVLNLEGATLRNPGNRVLNAGGLTVKVAMLCRKGFTTDGEVRLLSAQIAQLEFAGATLRNPGKVGPRCRTPQCETEYAVSNPMV